MNPEIKSDWVAALRDGTRTQGKGTLRDAEGNQCCLDVLCELAVNAGVIDPPVLADIYEYQWYSDTSLLLHTEQSVLPGPVRKWAGLTESNPEVRFSDRWAEELGHLASLLSTRRASLAEINDESSLTFPDIADLIEQDEEL